MHKKARPTLSEWLSRVTSPDASSATPPKHIKKLDESAEMCGAERKGQQQFTILRFGDEWWHMKRSMKCCKVGDYTPPAAPAVIRVHHGAEAVRRPYFS